MAGRVLDCNIKVAGFLPTELDKEVKFQFIKKGKEMEAFATLAKVQLDLIITQSKKRTGSKGRLENSIQPEKTATGWGVGNLEYMNKNAPYWWIVNYGGMVPITAQRVPGFFGDVMPPNPALSGTGVGRDSFTWDRNNLNNFFFMNVKNPIAPMNFIEKILMWAKTTERVHLSGWNMSKRALNR